jgi:hypothetical protein
MVSPMVRRLSVLSVLAVVLLGAAACTDDGSPTVDGTSSTTTTSTTSSTTSSTPGSGSTSSVPGPSTTTPGGPALPLRGATGSGSFTWSVDSNTAQFCYQITITGAGSATSARVLRGGDAVLTLVAPGVNGTVNTCSPTDSITVEQLQQDPADFTLEVVADKGTLKGALA